MDAKNQITFDFANNPELAALFAAWQIGESYELRVKFQLNEMGKEGAKGTIEQVTSSEEKAEEKPVAPDRTSPVMIAMGSGPSGQSGSY